MYYVNCPKCNKSMPVSSKAKQKLINNLIKRDNITFPCCLPPEKRKKR